MGFMNWLMKGVGFENEEVYDNSMEKQKKREEKLKEKTERQKQKEEYKARKAQEKADRFAQKYKLRQQKDEPAEPQNTSESYLDNPEQYNTSRTYNASVNDYGVNSSNVGGYGPKNVEFLYPTKFDDVQFVINFLKEGEAVMLNISQLGQTDAQRLLDCSYGAIYALNGNIKHVDNNIYFLTPEGFNLKSPNGPNQKQ